MFRSACAALGVLALASVAAGAHAQEPTRWFVHAGPALVSPDESAKVAIAGSEVPGGNVSIKSRASFQVSLGYYLTPHIAIAVAGGYPPEFKINGAGTLAAAGTAGSVRGGPAGVAVQYHFNRSGRVQPYVGAGAALLAVLSAKDGALSNFKAKSAVGPMVEVGADVMMNERWSLYADVKKTWVKSTATGLLGPAPVRARVTVDPLVPSLGVGYHF
jgi:outer membrane protein